MLANKFLSVSLFNDVPAYFCEVIRHDLTVHNLTTDQLRKT